MQNIALFAFGVQNEMYKTQNTYSVNCQNSIFYFILYSVTYIYREGTRDLCSLHFDCTCIYILIIIIVTTDELHVHLIDHH